MRSNKNFYGAVSRSGIDFDGQSVVFIGFLSNESELRKEFPDAPFGPAGLIAAMAANSVDSDWIGKLWGEYAVAAVDKTSGVVRLIRDRVGFYVIYYHQSSGTLRFATTLSLLIERAGIIPEPDRETIARFIGTHYRHLEGDRRATSFAGIRKVPPGSYLEVSGGKVTEREYWNPRREEWVCQSTEESAAADELRALLEDAVQRRVRDVTADNAAFALSSGMDSSSVLSLAGRHVNGRPRAYTSSFEGWADDETHEVRHTGPLMSQWQPVVMPSALDLLDSATQLQREHDEPVVTVTWLWDFFVQQRAAEEGAGVFFGGLGGDELFAGEFEHFFFFFADLDAAGEKARLDREIESWIRLHDHPVHHKTRNLVIETWRRMRGENGAVRTNPVRFGRYLDVLTPEFQAAVGTPPDLENPYPDYLRNRLWQDFRSETTLPCLRAATGNAAAHGIEMRFPFLDHRVVEWAFSIPGDWKIRHGVTKHILRAAMRGILPSDVTARARKVGWSSPADQMFRGGTLEKLRALIDSSEWVSRDIYDRDAVQRKFTEHESGAADHAMFLWQFAVLEAWWRRWFG